MMNKKLQQLGLLWVILHFALEGNAQHYLVKHDFLQDKSDYFRIKSNGDTILLKNNKIKGKADLTLQVTNYNPFFWKTDIETVSVSKEEDNDPSKLFNPLLLLKQMGGSVIEPFLPINLSGGSRGVDKLNRVFIRYKMNYNEMAQLMDIYNQYDLVLARLKELKFDSKDPEAIIKQEAKASISKLTTPGPLQLDSIRLKARSYDNHYQLLKVSIDTLYHMLTGAYGTEDYTGLDEAEKELWDKIRTDIDNFYQPKIKSLGAPNSKGPSFSEQADSAIGLYKEISNTTFEYHYKVLNAREVAYVKLRATPNPEIRKTADSLIRYIPVNKKSGLRLTNSFGIAFSVMNERSYYVGQDSVIASSRANLFNPLICSFVHFYNGNTSGVKWGGNLGVGISMANTEKGVAFLSGLSLIFGRHDEMLLSAGIAGTRITVLSKGLREGDKFNQGINATLPTEALYRAGGFLSFSFNIAAFTNKKG